MEACRIVKNRWTATFHKFASRRVDTSSHRTGCDIGWPDNRADTLARGVAKSEVKTCTRRLCGIALAPLALNNVIADLKLPSTLDILVCQTTITDEFSRNLQFNGPQTKPQLVVIPEIPLDPCPHLVGIRHFGVKGSGIRIGEYLIQCPFVVQTVGAQSDPFGLRRFLQHP